MGTFPVHPFPHTHIHHKQTTTHHYMAALTQGAISPRPLVPIFEPGTTSHPPAAAWLCAMQIFANLAIPHPCLKRRTSHIMARVSQHFVVGEHTP